jgi:hypothetical protein
MPAEKKKIDLGELLERLTATENLGTDSVLFRGVAVSRSETALHLGTDGGIVEIPLAEIEEVSEIGGHPNAVAVSVKDSSRVRVIQIDPGDDEGAASVSTALLSLGASGGTIPSGGFGSGTRSTRSFKVRNNDWLETVIDDWKNAVVL